MSQSTKLIIGTLVCIFIIVVVGIVTILVLRHQREKENSIFRIKELLLYSGVNVMNPSNNPSLINLNISQYSDLSLYIDNSMVDSELTAMNTIKELYIDNISITSKVNGGTRLINYKTPLNFGKYQEITQPVDNRIDFEILSTNAENDIAEYTTPTFYTDCTNPITLGYVNKDIITNYSISNANNKVSYNAKVLKEANLNLGNINNTLSFTVHLTNNANHKFSCNVNLNLSLDKDFIDSGYSYIRYAVPEDDNEYRFLRD